MPPVCRAGFHAGGGSVVPFAIRLGSGAHWMEDRSATAVPSPDISWELVRKRNFVERLKHEKGGLAVIHDLPAMIEAGYEAVPEEDFVRMQWYGLYHDKPKLGYFML